MKMKKAFKRIMAGILCVTMAGGIFFGLSIRNTQDVYADSQVFQKIKEKFGPEDEAGENGKKIIRILEISTSDQAYTVKPPNGQDKDQKALNVNSEIGYFMPYNRDFSGYGKDGNYAPKNLGFASQGAAHGNPGSESTDDYEQMIWRFREYGLVKPNGVDIGWNNQVGEYPLYQQDKSFSKSPSGNGGYKEINGHLAMGVYVMNEHGTGKYKLADGYVLDDNNAICTVSYNSVPSVSGNGTLSGNLLPTDETEMVIGPPVSDIDLSKPGLPVSTSGFQYIERLESDTGGNLDFHEADDFEAVRGKQQYYGYSKTTIWYAPLNYDGAKSRNSGWFAEYVLGSYKTYKDTELKYSVKSANSVTAADIEEADLVYVSGTDAEFKTNDLPLAAVKALYESTINDHKAIMMDFAGYDEDSTTNYSTLCALLWQESQDTLLSEEDSTVLFKDPNNNAYRLNTNALTADFISRIKGTMLTQNQKFISSCHGNFVIGNVYVYDHHMDYFEEPKSMVDALDNFANGDFNTQYKTDIAKAGFNNVLKYISATDDNLIEGTFSGGVTPAIAIQFILVNDGTPLTVMKNTLNVLEIQAAPTYIYNPGRGSYEYDELAGALVLDYEIAYEYEYDYEAEIECEYLYEYEYEKDEWGNVKYGQYGGAWRELPQKDANGNVIYKLDGSGNKIIKRNSWDNSPIYFLDDNGNKIPVTDENGNFKYVMENGQKKPVLKNGKKVYLKDENGNYLPLRNTDGSIVYKVDGSGNKIPLDKKIQIYKGDPKYTKYVDNRDEFITTYLDKYYDTKIMRRRVNFTSMTVSEFNGRNEDLIEKYDIIYIGDELVRQNEPADANESESSKISGEFIYNYKVLPSLYWDERAKAYATVEGDKIPRTRVPAYNDSAMNGMIYYNIGDKHSSLAYGDNNGTDNIRLYGFVKDELKNSVKVNDTPNNNNSIGNINKVLDLRFPGRDITKDKLKKLMSFVDAKALVIVAEELYGDNKINPTMYGGSDEERDHGRVDSSSNMYEFLKYAQGYRWSTDSNAYVNVYDISGGATQLLEPKANVVSAADVKMAKVQKSDLNQYVASKKLNLILSNKPLEYGYKTKTSENLNTVIEPTTVTYLDNDTSAVSESGKRVLKYEFSVGEDELFSNATDSNGQDLYECRLYIDINNDGKFSTTIEDVSDIKIVGPDGKAPLMGAGGHYCVYPGIKYTLTREITDQFHGILKWKLALQSENDPTIHVSEEGYTAVKNLGEKTLIKILQLTRNSNSNMNLMEALNNEKAYINGSSTVTAHDKWGKYLVDLPDYELEIRTMTVGEFEADFMDKYRNQEADKKLELEAFSEEYFNNFVIKSPQSEPGNAASEYAGEMISGVNMLVLGFGDNFDSFNNAETIDAVKNFIENGNPVLLTHDFIMYNADKKQTRALREAVGMDKYGVTQNIVTSSNNYYLENRFTKDYATDTNSGVTALHDGVLVDRDADADKLKAIESTGKEVAYQPGSLRSKMTPYTQAFSYATMERFSYKTNDYTEWMTVASAETEGAVLDTKDNVYYTQRESYTTNAEPYLRQKAAPGMVAYSKSGNTAVLGSENHNDDSTNYLVDKINDGQITQYPYLLPEQFMLNSATHSQYFELDLTSDADDDGESDVVVWYSLGATLINLNGVYYEKTRYGDALYSDTAGGSTNPSNGYFIYNKGNITYTGAGHSDMRNAEDTEIQLFVNTLLASYQAGNVDPETAFYDSADSKAQPISAVIVPYDGVVTKPAAGDTQNVDSSILKNDDGTDYKFKFVDANQYTNNQDKLKNGTMVYYTVTDLNLIRGTKNISVRYLLETDEEVGKKIKLRTTDTTEREVSSIEILGNKNANVIDISDVIETYKVTNGQPNLDSPLGRNGIKTFEDGTTQKVVDSVESGKLFGIYLPMDLLNHNGSFKIYLEAQTTVTTQTTSGKDITKKTNEVYIPLSVVKADLLDLD